VSLRSSEKTSPPPNNESGQHPLTQQMVRARAVTPVLSAGLAVAPARAPEVELPPSVPRPAHVPAGAPTFAALVGELAPFVLRVLPRLGVAPSDVEDVSQEVLLAVHRGLPRFEGRSSPRTWVYGICLRVARNHRDRAYVRRERPHAEPPASEPVTFAAEPALDDQRLIARLNAALSSLPSEQREAFVLHALEDLDVKEIAAAQRVSKFTVYTRLYTARRRLRAWFGERGGAEEVLP
jgi:RNA polymerase sigma-70 factor (ECF subfamily)